LIAFTPLIYEFLETVTANNIVLRAIMAWTWRGLCRSCEIKISRSRYQSL